MLGALQRRTRVLERHADRWVALVLIAIGGVFAATAPSYGITPISEGKAGLVPFIAGVSLILCATVVLFRRAGKTPEASFEPASEGLDPADKQDVQWVPGLVILGSLFAFVAITPVIGFVLSAAAMFLASSWAFGLRSWWKLAIGAIAVVLVMQLLFVELLMVPLPSGSLISL